MKNRKGFTIVELVIVIAVIAILAAVLIPTFTTVTANARASAAQSQAKNAQEAVLGNTEGVMPENTLFAIDNNNDGGADYFFVIEGRKLESKKLENLTDTANIGYPSFSSTTVGDTTVLTFTVFVTADYFSEEEATRNKVKDTVEGLVKDVLNYRLSGKTKASDKDHEGTLTASTTIEAGKDYAVWTYAKKTPVANEEINVNVYYNPDIAGTCVAFIAQ